MPDMADICSCCNLPKTTYETRYWKGTLDQLAVAARNGCLQCSFLAKCIACFASDESNEMSSFRAWDNFRICKLYNKMGDYIILDIFSISGR